MGLNYFIIFFLGFCVNFPHEPSMGVLLSPSLLLWKERALAAWALIVESYWAYILTGPTSLLITYEDDDPFLVAPVERPLKLLNPLSKDESPACLHWQLALDVPYIHTCIL